MQHKVFIGYDSRQTEPYSVCRHSLERHIKTAGPAAGLHIRHSAICLDEMRARGLYWRPTSQRDGQLWDDISEAPMSTEFAVSRFLTPHLAGREGWAAFIDCDMLWRVDPRELFALADPRFAVMCVKHDYRPASSVKMAGQAQLAERDPRAAGVYTRKLWSSVMLFNCGHAANARLDVDMVNTVPGRDLHAFKWLQDDEIGELPEAWNWIPNHSPGEPKLIHFTEGWPSLPGYESAPYANEWRAERALWLGE